MTDKFITLKCQSCGGKLDVYEDMKRFACGYCGMEMVVQRRGGTVSLERVTDAIEKITISTDKATAEMEISRLGLEREENMLRLSDMNENFEKSLYFIGGGIIALLSPLCWYHLKWLWAVLVLAGPVGWLVYRYVKRHYAKTREVQKKIDDRTARLIEIKKSMGVKD